MLSYRWKTNKWEDEPQSETVLRKDPGGAMSVKEVCALMKGGGGLASGRDGIAADIIKSYQPRILKIF